MPVPWPRSPLTLSTSSDASAQCDPVAHGPPSTSELLSVQGVTLQRVQDAGEYTRPEFRPSRVLATPRLSYFFRPHSSAGARTLRSPTSIRSMIDPSATAASSASHLSPITFDRPRASMLCAPACVLDYGGNVPMELVNPHLEPTLPLRGEIRTTRQPSRRQQRLWRTRGQGPRWIPRHSNGKAFFPAMRHPAIRSKVFHCIISGGLLLLIFIIFMSLMNLTSVSSQEFRIITILFILVFIVLFAHSMIRLLVLLLRLKKRGSLDRAGSRTGGFAQVSKPIRVVLARDEELGIGGTDAWDEVKSPPPPPPVYGHWRSSVRVDPNLIHWQRVERTHSRPLSEGTIRRPPSYISEGGHENSQDHNGR